MAIVIFEVRTNIPAERDEEFNRWYNEEHCPDLLSFRGCVGARRYRSLLGENRYQYLAVYEFQDEMTFDRWMRSDHRRRMLAEHEGRFGSQVDAGRSAYVQIWPA